MSPYTSSQLPWMAGLILACCIGAGLLYPCSSQAASTDSLQHTNTIPAHHVTPELIELVNKHRDSQTVCDNERFYKSPAVTWDERIGHAALSHATDLAENHLRGHRSSDGTTTRDRFESFTPDFEYHAEIINYASSADEAIQEWLDSPGHCKLMMREMFTHIGAAVAYGTQSAVSDEPRIVWVIKLGRMRDRVARDTGYRQPGTESIEGPKLNESEIAMMNESTIIIFSTQGCTRTASLVRNLTELTISHQAHDISNDRARRAVMRKIHAQKPFLDEIRYPVVELNGEVLVGEFIVEDLLEKVKDQLKEEKQSTADSGSP